MPVLLEDIELDDVAGKVIQESCDHDGRREKNVQVQSATSGPEAVAQAEEKLVHEGIHCHPVCERLSEIRYLPEVIASIACCVLKADPDIRCKK